MGEREHVDKNKKAPIAENLFSCQVTGGASSESNQVLTSQIQYRIACHAYSFLVGDLVTKVPASDYS
ncbi:hypothetical protein SAMN04515619_111136 [Collimonas sp. OK412]|jgi:hypothetical protein|nr:hypothetical protein SAMN04515619_111136 [Collimonas sp. OK412]